MTLLDFIRLAIIANRSSPTLRNRIRSLHLGRRLYYRRPSI